MDNFLTTRQVQDILKVDRITIYRMLQDGRLKGTKIGQQWRFALSDVERLMNGLTPTEAPALPAADMGLPIHCVQTIQNLFSDVSQLSALVVDMQGQPLTEFSNPCALCRLLWKSPAVMHTCQQDWLSFVRASQNGARRFTCQAGLDYVGEPVMDQEQQIGLFLSSGFYWQQPLAAAKEMRLQALASKYNLPFQDLLDADQAVQVISPQDTARIEAWPKAAVRAIHSVLQERSGFLDRLQQIANLTQI